MKLPTAIRNIYCIGRNYRAHAAELGNEVPASPLVFTKPTHSLVHTQEETVKLPGNRGAIHYEAELVLRVGRTYSAGISVDELIDQFALGIDFTLRDVQNELKKKGLPWLPAKGFLGSAVITDFLPFPGAAALLQTDFHLFHNGEAKQRGNTSQMIFDLQTLVDYIAVQYGIGEGDIIYTGTPEGVGAVHDGDRLELYWGDQLLGGTLIKTEG
ncbi:fumarylacetoacetate hydrolase family protein [Paenibacillus eucommiae]|uniref:2-keto-4-pentenoate hydratase/2-oxohepta-3-ene-1,7-dioic acid hydratase in catechol pathway n=1 Tax=Paenibacillus eucommiae TaxID=1355755 RepID=A0ABS4IP03_9BACL|nr:fumarylacetoacetate hydrolase family protein [Paenibacillus eucommiae]MBP1989288.1 2-keto-4-pentenoate hydratase/2-oxohepta-3-ene-1,7-dioic acid hydratase in catechol pathway [Paenibacillus eucommiae]